MGAMELVSGFAAYLQGAIDVAISEETKKIIICVFVFGRDLS